MLVLIHALLRAHIYLELLEYESRPLPSQSNPVPPPVLPAERSIPGRWLERTVKCWTRHPAVQLFPAMVSAVTRPHQICTLPTALKEAWSTRAILAKRPRRAPRVSADSWRDQQSPGNHESMASNCLRSPLTAWTWNRLTLVFLLLISLILLLL